MPRVFSHTAHAWALAHLPRAVNPSEYFKLCQDGNLERGLLSISGKGVQTWLKAAFVPCSWNGTECS